MSDLIQNSVVTVLGSVVVVVGGWLLNERSKRAATSFRRREQRYRELLDAFSRGFYSGSPPGSARQEARQRFLNEINLAWLYCPDEVIRTANAFLEAVRVGSTATADERESAGRAFVLSLRRDLVGRSDLRLDEFFVGTPAPE